MRPVGDEVPSDRWPTVMGRDVRAWCPGISDDCGIRRQRLHQCRNDSLRADGPLAALGERTEIVELALPCRFRTTGAVMTGGRA